MKKIIIFSLFCLLMFAVANIQAQSYWHRHTNQCGHNNNSNLGYGSRSITHRCTTNPCRNQYCSNSGVYVGNGGGIYRDRDVIYDDDYYYGDRVYRRNRIGNSGNEILYGVGGFILGTIFGSTVLNVNDPQNFTPEYVKDAPYSEYKNDSSLNTNPGTNYLLPPSSFKNNLEANSAGGLKGIFKKVNDEPKKNLITLQ